MPSQRPFAAVLEQAGATMVDRSGHAVPLHFGSSAGELAACFVAVGLADRADLSIVTLTGAVTAIEEVTRRLTGTLIAPGGALVRGDTTWCCPAPGYLLAVGEGPGSTRLAERLMPMARRWPSVTLEPLGDEIAGFELLGPRTEETLAALGVPHTLSPAVQTVAIAGTTATVVRRSWARALVLVHAGYGVPTWGALDHAGEPFGVTFVGADAVARFRFVEPLLTHG